MNWDQKWTGGVFGEKRDSDLLLGDRKGMKS